MRAPSATGICVKWGRRCGALHHLSGSSDHVDRQASQLTVYIDLDRRAMVGEEHGIPDDCVTPLAETHALECQLYLLSVRHHRAASQGCGLILHDPQVAMRAALHDVTSADHAKLGARNIHRSARYRTIISPLVDSAMGREPGLHRFASDGLANRLKPGPPWSEDGVGNEADRKHFIQSAGDHKGSTSPSSS